MKIVLATASVLTAAALTGCGGGSSGGGSAGGRSDDYNKGYEIAAQDACNLAFDRYFALDNVNSKDDYIKGCVDAVKANPGNTTNP